MTRAELMALRDRAKERHDEAVRQADELYFETARAIDLVLELIDTPLEAPRPAANSEAAKPLPLALPAAPPSQPSTPATPRPLFAPGDVPPRNFKELVRGIVRTFTSDFTLNEVAYVLNSRYGEEKYERPTLSGTLLRLAEREGEMDIVVRGTGTKPSTFRPKPRQAPEEGKENPRPEAGA
jgi:hypothetical protein